jgi:hypothetical protein
LDLADKKRADLSASRNMADRRSADVDDAAADDDDGDGGGGGGGGSGGANDDADMIVDDDDHDDHDDDDDEGEGESDDGDATSTMPSTSPASIATTTTTTTTTTPPPTTSARSVVALRQAAYERASVRTGYAQLLEVRANAGFLALTRRLTLLACGCGAVGGRAPCRAAVCASVGWVVMGEERAVEWLVFASSAADSVGLSRAAAEHTRLQLAMIGGGRPETAEPELFARWQLMQKVVSALCVVRTVALTYLIVGVSQPRGKCRVPVAIRCLLVCPSKRSGGGGGSRTAPANRSTRRTIAAL